jgi:hypothetical protein
LAVAPDSRDADRRHGNKQKQQQHRRRRLASYLIVVGQMGKRPAKRITNWFKMFAQFEMGMVHFLVIFWLAR